MALRFSSPNIINPRDQTKKAVIRASMLHNKPISPKASIPSSRSCMHNKVYEDKAMGIICYKDEKGEIVCEGYDEGPRYSRQLSDQEKQQERKRELLTPSFLQARKIHYVEDADFCQVVSEQ